VGFRSMDVRHVGAVVQVSRASCSSGLGSPFVVQECTFPFGGIFHLSTCSNYGMRICSQD
jgi:hypothetical protein